MEKMIMLRIKYVTLVHVNNENSYLYFWICTFKIRLFKNKKFKTIYLKNPT